MSGTDGGNGSILYSAPRGEWGEWGGVGESGGEWGEWGKKGESGGEWGRKGRKFGIVGERVGDIIIWSSPLT